VSRDQYITSTLDITGENEQPIINQFIRQHASSENLAVLYPGMRYTCDKPLLYFSTELLLSRGYDVLQLWSGYDTQEFEQLSQAEKTIQLIRDGQELLDAGRKASTYGELLLCGKSLGTLTMAFILNDGLDQKNLKTIWFTPLINLPPVSEAILALQSPAFIAGSRTDSTFSSGPVDEIRSKAGTSLVISDKADHSLEILGDTTASLKVLDRVITKLSEFID